MSIFYAAFAALLFSTTALSGQDYLAPQAGHKVAYFFSDTFDIQTYDVDLSYFYAQLEDSIYQIDPLQVAITNRYARPADYTESSYPSFLSIEPGGSALWVGFTTASQDDARIYRVDVATGIWSLEAKMPANYDLVFWGDSLLVSGLNSIDYNTPNGIYILDTTGNNNHRKIIETGGYSAGLATDALGNLYYASSTSGAVAHLYRWSNEQVAAVVSDVNAAPMTGTDATLLASLPVGMAASDVEVDLGGNVVFTMNQWGATSILARWDGNTGEGANFDTLAISTSWLSTVKSRGDFEQDIPGNSLFVKGYQNPMADLHTFDYPPFFVADLPAFSGYQADDIENTDLAAYVMDLDDRNGFNFSVEYMSVQEVASLSFDGSVISGSFGTPGQSNLLISAESAGKEVSRSTVIGSWSEIDTDEYADMSDLTLDAESYWNGSDLSASFSSGPARFNNDYSTEYFSWSGWAYSNTSDKQTPGYMNQYSAITGEGFDEAPGSDGIYAISNLYGPSLIDFPAESSLAPHGFYVTNSTYTALSMEEGDWVSKTFGGESGDDPDFFKLLIWGLFRGESTADTVEYYLADYRFDNNEEDYIVKTWQWVDLSPLGTVDTLLFGLESSDNGDWGMNTPAYFCLDKLAFAFVQDVEQIAERDEAALLLYPNPAREQIHIVSDKRGSSYLRVYSITGALALEDAEYHSGEPVNIEALRAGVYILNLASEEGIQTTRFIKQ